MQSAIEAGDALLAYRVAHFCKSIGLGKTKFYELVRDGKICHRWPQAGPCRGSAMPGPGRQRMSEPTSNRPDRDRLLYSVPRAAQLLSLGTSTVWALLADGTLASVSIGRSRRIPHSELVKLCTKQEVENTPMSHA